MTQEARRMADKHLFLKKMLRSSSPLYKNMPQVRERNEREFAETIRYFNERPGMLELYIAKHKPTYLRRRKDVKAWEFKVQRNGKRHTKRFFDTAYGSEEKAHEAAKTYALKALKKLEKKC